MRDYLGRLLVTTSVLLEYLPANCGDDRVPGGGDDIVVDDERLF
jgi:hypothetical protein